MARKKVTIRVKKVKGDILAVKGGQFGNVRVKEADGKGGVVIRPAKETVQKATITVMPGTIKKRRGQLDREMRRLSRGLRG